MINKTTCGPYWVMYDSECGFCYRVTRFFKFFDTFNYIQWISKDWKGDFPIEGKNRVGESVVVYDPLEKKLYFKSHAVSKIIRCIPFGFLISWILVLPGLSVFFDRFYDIIAKNRMRICKKRN